jgi:hypothetical protein
MCFFILLEFSFPFSYQRIETVQDFPPVYHYLQTLPADAAVLEMPFYNWNMSPYAMLESRRMYYATISYIPRLNGGSGYSPQPWQHRTMEFIYNFPDAKTVGYLKQIKITHIVLHKVEYDAFKKTAYTVNNKPVMHWDTLQRSIKHFPEITLIKQFGNDYVYQIQYEKR